ncbi:hypothetical protein Psuf_068040 [Phytohabitans suffuscus]|uniref:Uncharacterized protein n=2 Tax=Phytohabitans suffuscus TaxID=624315 RepID=A0A6F8YUH9_9ACTN|nr:hypothetical protein Psuf_068040 [Phytohabitans suffuscus]
MRHLRVRALVCQQRAVPARSQVEADTADCAAGSDQVVLDAMVGERPDVGDGGGCVAGDADVAEAQRSTGSGEGGDGVVGGPAEPDLGEPRVGDLEGHPHRGRVDVPFRPRRQGLSDEAGEAGKQRGARILDGTVGVQRADGDDEWAPVVKLHGPCRPVAS